MIGAIVLTLRQEDPPCKRQDVRATRPTRDRQDLGGRSSRSRSPAPASTGEELRLMEVGLQHYLAVAAMLFTIGVFGIFVNRKNVIIILMSVELILLAVNINFVAFSAYLNDVSGADHGHVRARTVAAAEAAVGLAILVTFFRNRGDIAVDDANGDEGADRRELWNCSSPSAIFAPLLGADRRRLLSGRRHRSTCPVAGGHDRSAVLLMRCGLDGVQPMDMGRASRALHPDPVARSSMSATSSRTGRSASTPCRRPCWWS